MAPRHPLLLFVHRLAGDRGATPTDADLLRRFLAGDESAFALLVERHASLVWGVCSRLSTQPADAEDAFQATFLILARKAKSLRRPDMVGPWLYGVARKVAARARNIALRRRPLERPLDDAPARPETPDVVWRELRSLLDEEIGRLPERFRTPFVLCQLQGLTNEEAALRLGCPKGTIDSRLFRARERLRGALRRRGVEVSGATLTAVLADQACSAAPAALVAATARSGATFVLGALATPASALANAILRGMIMNKLKWACAAFVAACLVGSGAGIVSRPAAVEAADEKPTAELSTQANREKPSQPEKAALAISQAERPLKTAQLLAQKAKFGAIEDPKETLLEALTGLADTHGLRFEINEKAFKSDSVQEVAKIEIAAQGPITPTEGTLDAVLRKILARIPAASSATFLVRDDYIEITTGHFLALELKHPDVNISDSASDDWTIITTRPLVYEDFNDVPLSVALARIADRTGINVVMDPGAEVKVTAKFRNVRPETAVQVLADIADLEVVQTENILHVTSPAKALHLREKAKPVEAPKPPKVA
jgi:RNA polymerase sigma factor (sigma-70 family)